MVCFHWCCAIDTIDTPFLSSPPTSVYSMAVVTLDCLLGIATYPATAEADCCQGTSWHSQEGGGVYQPSNWQGWAGGEGWHQMVRYSEWLDYIELCISWLHNYRLCYDPKRVPTTKEEWEGFSFIDKTHWGYYCWPKWVFMFIVPNSYTVFGTCCHFLQNIVGSCFKRSSTTIY